MALLARVLHTSVEAETRRHCECGTLRLISSAADIWPIKEWRAESRCRGSVLVAFNGFDGGLRQAEVMFRCC
jgi:hypothetical protein